VGSPPDAPGQQLCWIHPSPHGGAGAVSWHRHTVWHHGPAHGQCTISQLAHPGHDSTGPPAPPQGRYRSSTTPLQIQRRTCRPVLSSLTGVEQQGQGTCFYTSLDRQIKMHSLAEMPPLQGGQGLAGLHCGQGASFFPAIFQICKSSKNQHFGESTKTTCTLSLLGSLFSPRP